jgi:homoserine acetyltransferase
MDRKSVGRVTPVTFTFGDGHDPLTLESGHTLGPVDHLGISRLYCVAGGSMGGFQVLEWSLRYPQMVRSAISIASAARLSTQAIAFNAVGRSAITRDPEWQGDRYTTLTLRDPTAP